MSSIIDQIFDKKNLIPALVIGLIIILAAALPELILWFVAVLAIFVIILGLLVYLGDRKDFMPLIVMVVGIVALVLWVWRWRGS